MKEHREMIFEKMQADGFEQLVFCNDSSVGLQGIISIHSSVLGPATGGCRMWNYLTQEDALTDVLRLSQGMTYKAAISGLDWGGGKAVLLGDPKTQKVPGMLERFGEFVERLGGHYITAKDVGITSPDLLRIKTKTQHVLGIEGENGSSGDPSPATAWGVYAGMKSAAKSAYKTDSLKGLKIALQGLGSVAYYLLEHLMQEGAEVLGCDIDPFCIERAVSKYGIEVINPEFIYDVKCDIFAPCALGASINPQTLPRLQAKVIAGAANNQLSSSEIGYEIMKRGIIYAPDYAINAGGLINIYYESLIRDSYSQSRAYKHVSTIGETITKILERSSVEKMPSHLIADRMAEERIAKAKLERL